MTAAAVRAASGRAEFVVISGLSGAGRSEVANILEDLGYLVIDNLPPSLIGPVGDLAMGGARSRVALVVGAQGGAFATDMSELREALAVLRERGVALRIVFLEASDEVLVRRFDATRRRHPLGEGGVPGAIALERTLLRELREDADVVIDTSALNVHELRDRVVAVLAGSSADGLLVTVTSFGFKYGLPIDADTVLDVRFLPNPHWVEYLRPKTGLDPDVREYVLGQAATQEFLERARELFRVSLPGYRREAKHYLNVAVGCTGGKHRSVVLATELGAWFAAAGLTVNVNHRDVDRE